MRRRNSKPLNLGTSITTQVANAAGIKAGKSRGFRDSVTRVTTPIKVKDTNSRQWNRWSP